MVGCVSNLEALSSDSDTVPYRNPWATTLVFCVIVIANTFLAGCVSSLPGDRNVNRFVSCLELNHVATCMYVSD